MIHVIVKKGAISVYNLLLLRPDLSYLGIQSSYFDLTLRNLSDILFTIKIWRKFRKSFIFITKWYTGY